jgi:hypothetical protein
MLATMPKETVSKVTRVTRKAAGGAVAGKTATTSSAPSAVGKAAIAPPTPEMVAMRAYEIYLEEGRPEGREIEHWTRAEAELLRN